LTRVDEDKFIDTSLITHAEYQLFLDESIKKTSRRLARGPQSKCPRALLGSEGSNPTLANLAGLA